MTIPKFKETPGYVMHHGRRIEVITRTLEASKPKKKSFEIRWVKLPKHWIDSLAKCRSTNTYRLANLILLAAYKDSRRTGEVILSAKLTGNMSPVTRRRAARELERLGLITLGKGRRGKYQALRARIV